MQNMMTHPIRQRRLPLTRPPGGRRANPKNEMKMSAFCETVRETTKTHRKAQIEVASHRRGSFPHRKILEHPRRPQASKRPRHRQEPRAGRGDAAARAEAWMRRWEILHGVERQGETTLTVFPVLRGGRHPRRPLAGQRQRPPDKVDDLTHLYHKKIPQGVAVHPLGL